MKTNKWKYFKLTEYFDVKAGINHYKNQYAIGNTPYCSNSSFENGIKSWINLKPDFSGNKIVIGKIHCRAFYQLEPFCVSNGYNVLLPKFKMTKNIALFLVTIINKDQNYRWNYGRKCNIDNLLKMRIKLPSDKFEKPNWNYMEKYIDKLNNKLPRTKNKKSEEKLNTDNWGKFKLKDIAKIYNGKRISKKEILEYRGDFPVVQSSEANNGITGYISKEYCQKKKYAMSSSLCLTVSGTGSSGFVAVQRDGCVVGRTAKIIKLNKDIPQDIKIYLFIATLLKQNRFKYNNRKVTKSKYLNTIIKLPIKKENNTPDWNKIKKYIKKMPYGDCL